jgi:hypothetical protein
MKRLEFFFKDKQQLLRTALVAVFVAPLLAHTVAGHFTRMLADDYCFGAVVLAKGPWDTLVYWYNNWSGGYASVVTQSFVALLSPGAVALLPGLLVILWWLALIWTSHEMSLIARLKYPIFITFLLSSLALFATLDGSPNIYQSLYWTSASLTYVAPMTLLTFYAAFVLTTIRRNIPLQNTSILLLAISGLMTFSAGGHSETFIALQTTGLFLAVGAWAVFVSPSPKRLPMALLLIGLVASILALVIMLAAPGNSVRQSNFRPPTSLPTAIGLTLQNAAAFFAIQMSTFSTVHLLICVMVGGWIGFKLQPLEPQYYPIFKRVGRLLLLSAAVGFVLVAATVAPAAYGIGRMIPARAFIVPQFVLILVALVWGYIMGVGLQRKRPNQNRQTAYLAAVLLALLLVLGPIRNTLQTLSVVPSLSTFAAEWDARDTQIRAATARGVTVMTLPSFSVDLADYVDVHKIDDQLDTSFKACAESYYGLQSLTIE